MDRASAPPKSNSKETVPSKPPRPQNLAHGRWLGDFGRLSTAEKRLVVCCAKGEMWKPVRWNGERPEKGTASNKLRAELIRFLLLGGDRDNPVHAKSPMIRGAFISGHLDLDLLCSERDVMLLMCSFEHRISAQNAHLAGIYLNGSHLPAFNAQGIEVKGGIFLVDGFKAEGEVSLSGAMVGGQLSCKNAHFLNPDGDAIDAQGIEVKGDIFLTDGFKAEGEVRLSGAMVGGQLSCKNAHFLNLDGHALNAQGIEVKGDIFLTDGFKAEGEASLSGAMVGGQLSCKNGHFLNLDGHALNAQGIEVKGGIFLEDGFKAEGEVSLSGAIVGGQLVCDGGYFLNPDGDALNVQGMKVGGGFIFFPKTVTGMVNCTSSSVGDLLDSLGAWPSEKYYLDGFRYERLHGDRSANGRIGWLKGQVPSEVGDEFAPQPWEHLVHVMRSNGHTGEALEVAIAKQDIMRSAGLIGSREAKNFDGKWFPNLRKFTDRGWNPVSNRLSRLWHYMYGALSGYGYKPQRIVYLLFVMIFASSIAYYEGRHDGLIGPTDPLVNMAAATNICGTGGDAGKIFWTDPGCPVPPEYSTFQPFFYAIDVTLPLVDLGQEVDWSPVVVNRKGDTLWGGRFLRWLMWFNIIFGWLTSLMLVAILGRLVEKD